MPRCVQITLIAAFFLSFTTDCIIDYNRRIIGIREVGNNGGLLVEKFQSHCNLDATNFEWCAATVLSGHKSCSYDFPPTPCRADSWFDSTHTVYKRGSDKSLIKEGQVAGYYVRSKGRIGHNGTIIAVSLSGNYALVAEGNSRDSGNKLQQGDGVHLLRRSLDEITATSDWSKGTAKYHTVQPKETLYRLSVMYKVSVTEIKRLNNFKSDIVSIGQRVRVK